MSEPWEIAKGYDTETTIPIGAIGSHAAPSIRRHFEMRLITILLTNAAE
jgi:hypothetical protein